MDRLCPAASVLLCQYGRVGTVTKEVNEGSPMRVYDCTLCPECGETLYEKAIVGAYETEIK